MFPFPSFYFYTYLTLVKGSEKNQWQPISTFNSCFLFTFFPSFGFSFSLYLFPLLLSSSLPLARSKTREREKRKEKKTKRPSFWQAIIKKYQKHSWFAIGLNERTAFLIFFLSFSLTVLFFRLSSFLSWCHSVSLL